MSTKSWQVGDVRITRIVELDFHEAAEILFAGATREMVKAVDWLRPCYANEAGDIRLPFQAFVIEAGQRRIMVDTCCGNDKERHLPAMNMLSTPFLSRLVEAGFPPESIDTVVCTHLHGDHVGWNTRLVDGKWIPTFPNARYLFGRVEWENCSGPASEVFGDLIADSLRPVMDAGLCDLVETDHRLCAEIRLEPTPGHTPGHVSVHISSRGEEAIITGDLIHNPFQCAHPEISSNFCADQQRSRETRKAFLARCSDQPILVIGSHFADATAGHIRSDGTAYRFYGRD